jgi:coenzyme F420 biosynthesis associated uncharacterized protein
VSGGAGERRDSGPGPDDTGRRPGASGRGASGPGTSRGKGWRGDAFLQAGLLVGAAVGAAVTVATRRMERSARRGLVDWKVAERLAVDRVRNSPGTLTEAELRAVEPVYAAAMREVVPALGKALGVELPDIVERSAVVSRAEWVHANVATFGQLMGRMESRLLDQVVPPGAGFIRSSVAIVNRAATTRQFGFLLGFLGRRVLGQYDLAILTAEASPGSLLFLDENIRFVAANLGVPVNPFRTWIALHETTHAFEFEAHPWLRPYLAGKIERQLTSLSAGSAVLGRDVLSRIGSSLRGNNRGEHWMEGLMDEEQRRDFREIQAIMSLLEGFGDYVMDQVGAELVPDVETISERFHARREARSGAERAMMRITGLDLKMEQYKQGEAFVEALARERGAAALTRLWESPETLPRPEEIGRPNLWLERVMPAS